LFTKNRSVSGASKFSSRGTPAEVIKYYNEEVEQQEYSSQPTCQEAMSNYGFGAGMEEWAELSPTERASAISQWEWLKAKDQWSDDPNSLLASVLSFLEHQVTFSDLPEVIKRLGFEPDEDPERAARLVLSLVYHD